LLVLGSVLSLAYSQSNPAAREDAEIERQKILRAADQIEAINDQHNKMVEETDKLKAQLKAQADENAALSKQLADLKAQSAKEKDALLDQISKLLADQEKRLNEKIQAVAKSQAELAEKIPPPPKENSAKESHAPAKQEEGYEYVVKSGQTLWAIAKAYQDQGVKVTVDDIRKANNLKDGQSLKTGQKLFIPGK